MRIEFFPQSEEERELLRQTLERRGIFAAYDTERDCMYWSQTNEDSERQTPKQSERRKTIMLLHSDGPIKDYSSCGLPTRVIDRSATKQIRQFKSQLVSLGYLCRDPWKAPQPGEFNILIGPRAVRFRWHPIPT